jgi:hypothetical protein
MFCFNTKSKRYAIANIEVGKETFVTIKKLLVGLMAKELKETKRLGHGILDL